MTNIKLLIPIALIIIVSTCKPIRSLKYDKPTTRILFLHHSTGRNIWFGDINQSRYISFKRHFCLIPRLIKEFNQKSGKKISIEEKDFPSGKSYPWENYPYDYYNIWVKNAGEKPFSGEPTLEMLTRNYDVIIFKHCFPVSHIDPDDQNPSINSTKKTIANYKLLYLALRNKLIQFPKTKFIIWTGAALVKSQTTEQEALRAKEFFRWVKEEWDLPEDNIEIFDFRELETGGGLYMKPEFSINDKDSHPNKKLSTLAAQKFSDFIICTIN